MLLLYANSNRGSASTHWCFLEAQTFLIMPISVLFILSVSPLVWGWCVLARATLVPNASMTSFHSPLSNCVPLSVMIFRGSPCARTTKRRKS